MPPIAPPSLAPALRCAARCLPLMLGMALLTPALAADHMPPPGLYRVQSDAATQHPEGVVVRQHAGGDGKVTVTTDVRGQASRSTTVEAEGGRQLCIGERGNGVLPAMPAQSKCVGTPPVQSPQGLTSSAHCEFADFVTVVRQLDGQTWEMKANISMHMPGGGPATTSTVTNRLTRIGSSCKVATAPPLPKALR